MTPGVGYMKARRWAEFVAVVSVLGLVAAGVASAAPAGSATTGAAAKPPTAAKHTRNVKGLLIGIGCASRSLCVGYGTGNGYVIDTIKADGTKVVAHHSSTLSDDDVSCPSAAGCALLSQKAPTYDNVVVPVSKSGAIGKPIGLGAATTAQLTRMSCHPTRTHCTMVGVSGDGLDVVTLDGTTAVAHDDALPVSLAGPGTASVNGKVHGLVVTLDNGAVTGHTTIPAASNEGLVGMSCPTATVCEAIGFGTARSFAFTLHNGKLVHTAKAPKGLLLFGIACQSAHLCDGAGSQSQKVGNTKGAIVPIRNGRFGKRQITNVTTSYEGGSGEGTAVISAFHGGVAAIGGDQNKQGDTLLSIS
jgi:hypothetical protein